MCRRARPVSASNMPAMPREAGGHAFDHRRATGLDGTRVRGVPSRKRERYLRQVAARRTRRDRHRANVGPEDNLYVYLTADEILGAAGGMTMDEITAKVSLVPLELALAWCAEWVGRLHAPGAVHRHVDRAFVEAHLRGPLRERVLLLLADERRVLLTAQTLVVVAKLAIEHSRETGAASGEFDPSPLSRAVLGVAAHLTDELDDISDEELIVDVEGGRLATYLVANQLFNNPADSQTAWAVSQRCLREIPIELAAHRRIVDFEQAYLEATGVSLDDFVTVCSSLWTTAVSGSAAVPLSYLAPLEWERDRLEAALGLISATPTQLRDLLREDDSELGWRWTTKTFDRFPVVRLPEHLIVLHPSWLVNRSTGMWPLFDVRREAERRGDEPWGSKVAGSVQHAYEHYAVEVLEAVAGSERVYRDDALRVAYGKKGRVADAAVEFGSSWIVAEVTASGFQLKTAAGVSEETLGTDLDHLVEKARQLEATVDNLRRDAAALTGRSSTCQPRRFYPVVVVASRFAGNPITFKMLRARLREANVLQGPDCAPLEVLELEDLLTAEGVCEHHGVSLLDLLAEKSRIQAPLVSLREYLLHRLGGRVPYPSRVERSWQEWIGTAIRALRAVQE